MSSNQNNQGNNANSKGPDHKANKSINSYFALPDQPTNPAPSALLPYLANLPRSTMSTSRFFPGGQPAPWMTAQPQRAITQGNSEIAREDLAAGNRAVVEQPACAEKRVADKIAVEAQRPSRETFPSRPQPAASLNDLARAAAPSTTTRRLQGTAPSTTWATGQSWRATAGAPQPAVMSRPNDRQPAQQGQQGQQPSRLSPFAPAFQGFPANALAFGNAPRAPSPASQRALSMPMMPMMPMGDAPPLSAQGFDTQAGQHQPQVQGFRPMHQKLHPESRGQPLSREELEFRRRHGISENYQGEATNPQNISADISDDQNCGLWLTNLPPTCDYKVLLGAIAQHPPGRIFSAYITGPDEKSDSTLPSFRTSGAKIVFYRPQEAQRLLSLCTFGQFKVQGYRARCILNRVRSAPQPAEKEHTTRVLLISGPRSVVDELQLRRAWDGYFSFDTEEVLLLAERDGMRWLEWRFASHRAQAGSAFKFLKTQPGYMGIVSVRYGRDPCERAE